MSSFKKAVRQNVRLRMALEGPPGSGKTWTALQIARLIVGPTGRIALIDTEHESAALYADVFDFDHAPLHSHAPARYCELLKEADAEGYDVVIVDSLTHAWSGRDGALEQVDKRAAKSKSGNSFDAWRHVTPEHNKLVETLLSMRAHLIVTLRSKMAYVVEQNDQGKSVPKKLGMQAIQREGLEYEFSIVGDMDQENTLTISKTRCSELTGQVFQKPGADLANIIRRWLATGAPTDVDAAIAALAAATSPADLDAAKALARDAYARAVNGDRTRLAQAVKDATARLAATETTASRAHTEREPGSDDFASEAADPQGVEQ